MDNKQRKEVKLMDRTIAALQKEADRQGFSLKRYMERILIKEAFRLQKKELIKAK